LILDRPSRVERYIGMDLPGPDSRADLAWDGNVIPLPDASVDCALLTEVLEHCPEPQRVLTEVHRVLKPEGFLFITVPFIWPIHDVPHDEFRYTPYSLQRMLSKAGFADPSIEATGGRHAMLGVILGLWVRRRPLTSRIHVVTKSVLSVLLLPVVWSLIRMDRRPPELGESTLLVGLAATAHKASRLPEPA
jgi:SAM-dependent methyltransferase